MNEYKFEDIKINMIEEFEVTVTNKMQEDFRNVSGDINPIHSDDSFEIEKRDFYLNGRACVW